MRINHTKLFHGALFFVLAFLTACGGGGGGGSTAPATTYTIGGAVNGLTGTGLVLQNNGGGDLPITASGTFVFATKLASGATYTVTVKTQPSGQICTVSPYTGTVLAANITTVAVTCASPSNVYTIGGAVTGLTGTGLVLQNNGGDDLPVTASGNFVFASPLASGATYAVTVKTQPAGQTCTVNTPANTGTVTTGNIATVAVACTSATTTYTIGGSVNGLNSGSTGIVLQNNGGGDLTITTNGNFVFAATQISGTTYQVTVKTQPAGQTCTVNPSIGAVSSANVSVTVTCSTNTYTIGGSVAGLTATGLMLQNNGVDNLTVAANASAFTFSTAIASGAGYNVTVLNQPTGLTCTVNAPSGTVAFANVGNVSVTCSVSTYSIGGTIANLAGAGLVLQNNGGNNLTVVAASGAYTFATTLAYNSTYNITVLTQPAAQVCTVANASGTVTAAVTNANVTCVNSYTIGGTIKGAVAGVGPILQNNLGDNLFIPTITTSPTNFTFSTPILGGAPYFVTQRTRARAPSQDCSGITNGSSITNGSGTVGLSNVTNVLITCVLSPIVPKFAYVTNSTANSALGAADTVSAFTINDPTGILAAATTPTTASGDMPSAVTVDPTGQFAYVTNQNADSVMVYSIDQVSGALTMVDANGATSGDQPSIPTGDAPISIAVHPSGKFAYVVNSLNLAGNGNTISAYSINITSGALTAIDADGATTGVQTIATGSEPYAITIDPLGKFAYVANNASNNVSAYTIDQITGALTAVAGSPFAAGNYTRSIVIDPAGKYVFAANGGGDISAYSIDATTVPGKLTQINCVSNGISTCSGNNYTAGSAPRSITVDPSNGLYAYVANNGGGVSAFAINISTGELSAIDADAVTSGAQATIAAGTGPFSINVDPSGQFVYVANFSSDSISVYSITSGSGALTPLQTLANGAGPTSVTTTQ